MMCEVCKSWVGYFFFLYSKSFSTVSHEVLKLLTCKGVETKVDEWWYIAAIIT